MALAVAAQLGDQDQRLSAAIGRLRGEGGERFRSPCLLHGPEEGCQGAVEHRSVLHSDAVRQVVQAAILTLPSTSPSRRTDAAATFSSRPTRPATVTVPPASQARPSTFAAGASVTVPPTATTSPPTSPPTMTVPPAARTSSPTRALTFTDPPATMTSPWTSWRILTVPPAATRSRWISASTSTVPPAT